MREFSLPPYFCVIGTQSVWSVKQFVDVLKGKCIQEVLGPLGQNEEMLKQPEESELMEKLEVFNFKESLSSKLAFVSKMLGL